MGSVLELFNVKNRVAVITGAGSGIGAEVAKYFSSLGANTVWVDVDKARLDDQMRGGQGRCVAVTCNVTDEAQVVALKDETLKEFGRIDILVNSHGISRRASAEEMTAGTI